MSYFGPLQYYYSIEVDNFCYYSYIGVNKEYFIKLYPIARAKAFTTKTIYSAWKAIGLLPYNPTAILKTLLRIEDSIGLEMDLLITNISLYLLKIPKTPKIVEDFKSL